MPGVFRGCRVATYDRTMFGAVLMWTFLGGLVGLPVWFAWYAWDAARRRRRGDVVERPSGGTFGFDEIWRPSAAEAQAVWEAEQITPAPAPTPGDGPGVITGGRIVIETGLRHAPHDSPGSPPPQASEFRALEGPETVARRVSDA